MNKYAGHRAIPTFLDINRAFDTVWHKGLIFKSKNHQIIYLSLITTSKIAQHKCELAQYSLPHSILRLRSQRDHPSHQYFIHYTAVTSFNLKPPTHIYDTACWSAANSTKLALPFSKTDVHLTYPTKLKPFSSVIPMQIARHRSFVLGLQAPSQTFHNVLWNRILSNSQLRPLHQQNSWLRPKTGQTTVHAEVNSTDAWYLITYYLPTWPSPPAKESSSGGVSTYTSAIPPKTFTR